MTTRWLKFACKVNNCIAVIYLRYAHLRKIPISFPLRIETGLPDRLTELIEFRRTKYSPGISGITKDTIYSFFYRCECLVIGTARYELAYYFITICRSHCPVVASSVLPIHHHTCKHLSDV